MQLKPGTKLQGGKYEIVRTLGQGGFGITYEAVHTLFERKVAIKEFFMKDCCNRDMETSHVSVPSVGSKELVGKFKKKFIKEAKTIFELDHSHIVRVTDVFEENETAYYVMENLPGGSLADKIKKEGPLSEAQAEKYIRQVADALAYIHERNTVHLDIKPSNILLNAKGEAVLIDFGISKHYDKAGEQTSSTPIGISKGYAPMEQGRDGDVSQFKPSTDIYALGATLYHLVCGQVPPEASIVVEEGLDRPQGVSDRIWNVIAKSMQPKRKDRPQSIEEFLQLFDETTAQKKEDEDETEVITKKEPVKKPNIDKHDDDEKKPSRTKLWILCGVFAVVLGVVILKRPIPVTTIELSRATLELEPGQVDTLWTIIEPTNATDKTVTWRLSNETVATVDDGTIIAKECGQAIIFARCGDKEASCKVTVKEKPAPVPPQTTHRQTQASGSSKTTYDNGHEWVNLGLPSGTRWATCNVGASNPTEYGDYFAWGETESKSKYRWSNYKFYQSGSDWSNVTFTKYNDSKSRGVVDNKIILELNDDAAHVNWGGDWRMPTGDEFEELIKECTWTWKTKDNIQGYEVKSKNNGRSIFLPAAGWRRNSTPEAGTNGFYWSSSNYSSAVYAGCLRFTSTKAQTESLDRLFGCSIRPVMSVLSQRIF